MVASGRVGSPDIVGTASGVAPSGWRRKRVRGIGRPVQCDGLRVALGVGGDPVAPESITIKVFREVWRRPVDIASALGDDGLRRYLAARARNTAREWRNAHLDSHRRHGNPAWTMTADSTGLPDRAESEHAEVTRRRTLACMDRLTPQERRIIEAVAVEGDSVIEAAARMGVPLGGRGPTHHGAAETKRAPPPIPVAAA